MRAQCESCTRPQPADWRPGDLCIHCGHAVREEVRCYWCAHWIPAGNFCRSCGAEGIPSDQYASARMMKFYGADMFSIPRMLREMDPARKDTCRAIYGKHQAAVMRHVDELRELEQSLFSKHWSSELEDQLIPQLPWPEDQLALYTAPNKSGRQSPVPVIRSLADLVAMRNGEFRLVNTVGADLLYSTAELQQEAALQLANWRVAGNMWLEDLHYPVLNALRAIPQPHSSLVRLSLVYLGDKEASIPEDAATSDDPEVAFFASLLLQREAVLVDTLRTSQNHLQKMVIAKWLIRMKRAGAIRDFYRSADIDHQKTLLSEINVAKQPVPELHDALFETVEKTLNRPDKAVARAAAAAICLGCTNTEAMRLANLRNWEVLHMVALAKQVDPETYREIGEMLVREDMVVSGNFTWSNLTKAGKLPQDFVERVFYSASSKSQRELVRIAELQLEEVPGQPAGTPMERVLIHAAFGDYDSEVIAAAWAGMHRINYRREYGSISPFPYTRENVEKFWPIEEFEARLKRLQSNEEALRGTFVRDELDRFLRSAPK